MREWREDLGKDRVKGKRRDGERIGRERRDRERRDRVNIKKGDALE